MGTESPRWKPEVPVHHWSAALLCPSSSIQGQQNRCHWNAAAGRCGCRTERWTKPAGSSQFPFTAPSSWGLQSCHDVGGGMKGRAQWTGLPAGGWVAAAGPGGEEPGSLNPHQQPKQFSLWDQNQLQNARAEAGVALSFLSTCNLQPATFPTLDSPPTPGPLWSLSRNPAQTGLPAPVSCQPTLCVEALRCRAISKC